MNYTTIRISKPTHQLIKNIAKDSKLSLHVVIDKSVRFFAEKHFWEECQKAYSALHDNKKEWSREIEERKLWESTLLDDIE
jgi:hypothetical protein